MRGVSIHFSLKCAWLAMLLCLESFADGRASFASEKHFADIDDAYAVRSVGALEVNRQGTMLAMEAEGGIVVLSVAGSNARLAFLVGYGPVWSPNGQLLAFFGGDNNDQQLQVWNAKSGTTHKVTSIPGGISPLHSGAIFCPPALSWAPDSKKVVFDTRIMGDYRSVLDSHHQDPTIRVYDANYTIGSSILDGVFQTSSLWDINPPQQPELGKRMKVAQIDPELGRNRLVIADVIRNTWTTLNGGARHYFAPSWSPDGRTIAAAADLTETYPQTYFGGSISAQKMGLALFDSSSKRERRVGLPATRIGGLNWSPDGNTLAMVAETHPPVMSFPTLITYSLTSDTAAIIAHPNELAAKDVKWSSRGILLARYWDRFADSLWEIDSVSRRATQIQTYGLQIDSYAEDAKGKLFYNTQSANTKGRVLSFDRKSKHAVAIYDANPQLADLNLGEQRRVTWRNKGGDLVDGIVILPPDYSPGTLYPVIVFPYPMWPRDILWLIPQYEQPGQLQAARGYVIFRPALRAPHGSNWYTRGENYTDKARGAPGIPIMIDDFVSGVEYLESSGLVDPERVGLFGHSNAGWATNLIINNTRIAKAAVVASGISNAVMLAFFPRVMIPDGKDPATDGNIFDNFKDYVALSPIFEMRDRPTPPLLLTVGDDDWLWLPQMISQYQMLRQVGKDVTLVRYAHEGHLLHNRRAIEDALGRMNAFFDSHIGAGVSDGGSSHLKQESKNPMNRGIGSQITGSADIEPRVDLPKQAPPKVVN